MVVDEGGTFITSRQEPSLLLLRQAYNEVENCLEISSNNPERFMELLRIDLGHKDNSEECLRTLKLS